MTNKLKYHKNYTELGAIYQLVLPLTLECLVPDDDSVRLLYVVIGWTESARPQHNCKISYRLSGRSLRRPVLSDGTPPEQNGRVIKRDGIYRWDETGSMRQ